MRLQINSPQLRRQQGGALLSAGSRQMACLSVVGFEPKLLQTSTALDGTIRTRALNLPPGHAGGGGLAGHESPGVSRGITLHKTRLG